MQAGERRTRRENKQMGQKISYGVNAKGKMVALLMTAMVTAAMGTGCVHPIAFHPTDTSWHYSVHAQKQTEASMVAVIDEETAAKQYDFRAFSTGFAHKWVVEYGEMLEQVADVELPQLVGSYKRSTLYSEPTTGEKRLTLVLTVPSYVFEDYRAKMALHAEAFGPGRTQLFSRSYTSEGHAESGKMVGAGAFGQKSAVRQSSLDAFKRVFDQLRPDIEDALRSPKTAAP
jgi:hypothetical protein